MSRGCIMLADAVVDLVPAEHFQAAGQDLHSRVVARHPRLMVRLGNMETRLASGPLPDETAPAVP